MSDGDSDALCEAPPMLACAPDYAERCARYEITWTFMRLAAALSCDQQRYDEIPKKHEQERKAASTRALHAPRVPQMNRRG
jgi:hypothetical protein